MKEFIEVADGKRTPKLMTDQMYKNKKDVKTIKDVRNSMTSQASPMTRVFSQNSQSLEAKDNPLTTGRN